MYMKWANLSAISWGSTLPVFTNIAVIGKIPFPRLHIRIPPFISKTNTHPGITYSCIAPLMLGFATIGMTLFYLAYRYNVLFVTDSQIDTKGLIYPRALQQLLTGVYLAEVCLIGLFAIAAAIGPLIMLIVALIFTILYHIQLNAALDPLLNNLPKTLEMEEESYRPLPIAAGASAAALEANASHNSTDKDAEKGPSGNDAAIVDKKPNFLTKFFAPHIYSDYHILRRLVPQDLVAPESLYDDKVARNAYYPPSVTSETPLLWIPRDEAGVSAQEVGHTGKVIPVTDEGCVVDDKGRLVWDEEGARPPLWEEKIYY